MGTVYELSSNGRGNSPFRVRLNLRGQYADWATFEALFNLPDRTSGRCPGSRGDSRCFWEVVDSRGASRYHSGTGSAIECCPYHFGEFLASWQTIGGEIAFLCFVALLSGSQVHLDYWGGEELYFRGSQPPLAF